MNTLALALQSAFPQYPMTAHKKAGERMEKDMKNIIVTVDRCEEDDVGQTRMIVNTNCDYHRESDDWNALVSTLEAAPDLLAALERFVDIHSTGSTGLCIFCTKHRTKHTPECPMTQARAAIAKAKGGA